MGECETGDAGLEVMRGVRSRSEYTCRDQGTRPGLARVSSKLVEENECVLSVASDSL